MSNTALLEELVELVSVSEQLDGLDLENDSNDELLLTLQGRQRIIQERIEAIKRDYSISSYSDEEIHYLEKCSQLAHHTQKKLLDVQQQINSQLRLISSSKRTRSLYNTENIQSSGYFIDSQR